MFNFKDGELQSVICCCSLVVSPVLLCICFPSQKYIGRLQKELLASSLGTICGFVFFEIIPSIMHDASHGSNESGCSHQSHGSGCSQNKTQLYVLSCTILLGMLFAFCLGILHEFMEHKHCEESSNKHKSSRCLSWIPGTCKVIWIGTALHNLADGMIVGFVPEFKAALPLFIHEITHTLCNVTFYMTLGMTKCEAIILRIGSCIFVFLGAFGARLKAFEHLHAYGHAFVLGIFLYMMLVDVLPIVTGNQEHNHCIDQDEEKENDKTKDMKTSHQLSEETGTTTIQINEENKASHHHHHHHKHSTIKRKLLLFLVFAISFVIVALSIVCTPDAHALLHRPAAPSGAPTVAPHGNSTGCGHGPCHGHGHGHSHGHGHGHRLM